MAFDEENKTGDQANKASMESRSVRSPSRRRFVAGAVSAAPIVMTVVSKPAQAYECSHSALLSGRGSSAGSARRNPRACFNQEVRLISERFDPRLDWARGKFDIARARGDKARAKWAGDRFRALTAEKRSRVRAMMDRYRRYPGFR